MEASCAAATCCTNRASGQRLPQAVEVWVLIGLRLRQLSQGQVGDEGVRRLKGHILRCCIGER